MLSKSSTPIYLLPVAIFYFPSGLLLDRFPLRKILITSMSIAVCCSLLFPLSPNYPFALLMRFIIGAIHSIAFLGSICIVSILLAENKAFAIGTMITIGFLGGLFVQTPLVILVQHFGWKNALLFNGFIGIGILILIWIFIKENFINSYCSPPKHHEFKIFQNIKFVCMNKQTWVCAFYTCLLNLPLILLGALWGNLLLIHIAHYSVLQATNAITLLFLGAMFGTPITGWLLDKLKNRKIIMRSFYD